MVSFMNRTVVDDDELGRLLQRSDVIDQLTESALDEGLAVVNGNHY